MVNIGILGDVDTGKTDLLRNFVRYLNRGEFEKVEGGMKCSVVKTDFSGEATIPGGYEEDKMAPKTKHPNRVVFREDVERKGHTIFAPSGDRKNPVVKMGIITISRMATQIIAVFSMAREIDTQFQFFNDVRFFPEKIYVCFTKCDLIESENLDSKQRLIEERKKKVIDFFKSRKIGVLRVFLTYTESVEGFEYYNTEVANDYFSSALVSIATGGPILGSEIFFEHFIGDTLNRELRFTEKLIRDKEYSNALDRLKQLNADAEKFNLNEIFSKTSNLIIKTEKALEKLIKKDQFLRKLEEIKSAITLENYFDKIKEFEKIIKMAEKYDLTDVVQKTIILIQQTKEIYEKTELRFQLEERLNKLDTMIEQKMFSIAISELNSIISSAKENNFESILSQAEEDLENTISIKNKVEKSEFIKKNLNNVKDLIENLNFYLVDEKLEELLVVAKKFSLTDEINEIENMKSYFITSENLMKKITEEITELAPRIRTIPLNTIKMRIYSATNISQDHIVVILFKMVERGEIDARIENDELHIGSVEIDEDFRIFLSYSTLDTDFFRIREIANRLFEYHEVSQVEFWERDSGQDVVEFMEYRLRICNVLILFCSKNALDSKSVEGEWMAAYPMSRKGEIKIIPVFLDEIFIPKLLNSYLNVKFDLLDFDSFIEKLYMEILRKN